MQTDPVCYMQVNEKSAAASNNHQDRNFFFCTPGLPTIKDLVQATEAVGCTLVEATDELFVDREKAATVVRDNREIEIPVEEVVIGDTVIVKPGEKIPVDGIVLENHSPVDESMLSGKSIPVEKIAGEEVVGVIINKTGAFKFKAAMFLLMLFISGFISAYAEEHNDRNGWGIENAYHKYYDVNKFEAFKARVVKVKEVVPMAGMSPAVAFEVKKDGRIIEVQICPTWFVKPEEIGIKKGDRVTIRGAPATINGKQVFMASKIKKGDYFEFKVRLTKDGKPLWTMTPEELFGEKEQENEDNW